MREKDLYEMMSIEKVRTESQLCDGPTSSCHSAKIGGEKGMQLGEAADMYGNFEDADDLGYVIRGYDAVEPRNSKVVR